jgi:hypothetical protein
MSKPVNLRQFRKQKARSDKAKTADANRIAHGQPKSATKLARIATDRASRELDGKRFVADTAPPADELDE